MATRKKAEAVASEETAALTMAAEVIVEKKAEPVVWHCRDCAGRNEGDAGACAFCGEQRP